MFFGTKTWGALPPSPTSLFGVATVPPTPPPTPPLERISFENLTDMSKKKSHLINCSVTLTEFNTSLRSLNCPPHRDCSFNVLLLSRSSSVKCYCGCPLFRLENLDNWEKHWASTQNLYVYLYSYIYLYLFCQSK